MTPLRAATVAGAAIVVAGFVVGVRGQHRGQAVHRELRPQLLQVAAEGGRLRRDGWRGEDIDAEPDAGGAGLGDPGGGWISCPDAAGGTTTGR
jgi:hypothetical protein